MARAKQVVWITGVTGLALVVLAGMGAAALQAQVPPATADAPGQGTPLPRPPAGRARSALSQAIDLNRSGDYEGAAPLLEQARAGWLDLNTAERQELANYLELNKTALQARRTAEEQISQAQQAYSAGRVDQAADLLKKAARNRDALTQEDRRVANQLSELIWPRTAPPQQPGAAISPGAQALASAKLREARSQLARANFEAAEQMIREAEGLNVVFNPSEDTPRKLREDIAHARTDPKFLLGAARAAFQHGDLNRAEQLADAADKASSSFTFPFWADSPAKLRKEVQSARTKTMPVVSPQATSSMGGTGQPATIIQTAAEQRPVNDLEAQTRQRALQLIQQARAALQRGDVVHAQQFADQARALNADLHWWEDAESLDRLQAEIQNARSGRPAADARPPTAPAVAEDPRTLLKLGREKYAAGQLEEAGTLAQRARIAGGSMSWGLFADNPDKLLNDVDRASQERRKEESVRVLAEGRRLMEQGDLEGAEKAALHAMELHGPYSIWDLGDRPQKLYNEVKALQAKRHPLTVPEPGPANLSGTQRSQGPETRNTVVPPVPDPPHNPTDTAPLTQPVVRTTSLQEDPARQRVLQAVAEARQLQGQGRLLEAAQKLQPAQGATVVFGPGEDNPSDVLQQLRRQAATQIDALMQQAEDQARRAGNEPARFRMAEESLNQARLLAVGFGLSTITLDDRLTWLRQIRTGESVTQRAAAPPPGGTPEGIELLQQAAQALWRGETTEARRKAVEAYKEKYGVRAQAEDLLRSIDTEDFNQQCLAMGKAFDAAMQAYRERRYEFARNILTSVDARLLDADRKNKLSELMMTPEMQPTRLVKAQGPGGGVPGLPGVLPPNAGKVSVSDGPMPAPQDDFLKEAQARQVARLQALRSNCLQVQSQANELFKDGEADRALQILRDFADSLSQAEVPPDQVALLRRQLDARMQQFRTLKAQQDLEAERLAAQQPRGNPRGPQILAEQNKQKQVADLMARYETLYKEAKFVEAERLAQQAHDLDPDNPACGAAVKMAKMEIRVARIKELKDGREDVNLRSLDDAEEEGPYVGNGDIHWDKDRALRARDRQGFEKGISTGTKSAIEKEIEYRLKAPVSLKFTDTPLKKALDEISAWQNINIFLDEKSLQDEGINPNQPLSFSKEGISLHSALDLMLGQLHLTHVIQHEVLFITTEAHAKGKLVQRIFQVADLVIPVRDALPDTNGVLRPPGNWLGPPPGPQPALQVSANAAAVPYVGPDGIQGGQMVSSSGAPAPPTSSSGFTRRGPEGTIEGLLIDLITRMVKPESWSSMGGQGTIDYFPLGMALIINQTPDIQEQVADLLAALRRLQDLEVAIEVRFITIAEGFFERIGVDFSMNIVTSKENTKFQPQITSGQFAPTGFLNSFQPNGFLAGLQPGGVFTNDLNIPIRTNSFQAAAPPPFGGFSGAVPNGGLDVGLAFLSDIQVFLLLEAVQHDQRTNVMQAPKLTMFNGQTATLNVTDQQGFVTQVNVMSAGGQISFQPANQQLNTNQVQLTLQPVVSADRRFVRLTLQPQLQNLASAVVPLFPVVVALQPLPLLNGNFAQPGIPVAFTQFIQQPVISTISVQTTVLVPDGGTVLMGGLKRLSEGRNEAGPPVISKIPYIDRLFRNVGYGRELDSLMLMVTPRIIITEEEERRATGIGEGPAAVVP